MNLKEIHQLVRCSTAENSDAELGQRAGRPKLAYNTAPLQQQVVDVTSLLGFSNLLGAHRYHSEFNEGKEYACVVYSGNVASWVIWGSSLAVVHCSGPGICELLQPADLSIAKYRVSRCVRSRCRPRRPERAAQRAGRHEVLDKLSRSRKTRIHNWVWGAKKNHSFSIVGGKGLN